MPGCQLAETLQQSLTRPGCVVEQLLGLDDVEDRRGRGDADRIAAKGVEVTNVSAEFGHYLLATDDGSDRHAVAHRLSHDDQVGHEGMSLKSPPGGSEPSEPWLDFVGDPQSTRFPYRACRRRQKPCRIGMHSVTGHDGVHDHSGESDATLAQIRNRPSDSVCEVLGHGGRVVALRIGGGDQCHVGADSVVGPQARRYGRSGSGGAVIGVGRADDALGARLVPGDPQGEVDRLTARARVDDLRQFRREEVEKSFRVRDHGLGEVAGVGIEDAELFIDQTLHVRVAVADGRDVVVGVQVLVSVGVVQPHTRPADRDDGVAVEQPVAGREHGLSSANECLRLGAEMIELGPVEGVGHVLGVRNHCYSLRVGGRRHISRKCAVADRGSTCRTRCRAGRVWRIRIAPYSVGSVCPRTAHVNACTHSRAAASG